MVCVMVTPKNGIEQTLAVSLMIYLYRKMSCASGVNGATKFCQKIDTQEKETLNSYMK